MSTQIATTKIINYRVGVVRNMRNEEERNYVQLPCEDRTCKTLAVSVVNKCELISRLSNFGIVSSMATEFEEVLPVLDMYTHLENAVVIVIPIEEEYSVTWSRAIKVENCACTYKTDLEKGIMVADANEEMAVDTYKANKVENENCLKITILTGLEKFLVPKVKYGSNDYCEYSKCFVGRIRRESGHRVRFFKKDFRSRSSGGNAASRYVCLKRYVATIREKRLKSPCRRRSCNGRWGLGYILRL